MLVPRGWVTESKAGELPMAYLGQPVTSAEHKHILTGMLLTKLGGVWEECVGILV